MSTVIGNGYRLSPEIDVFDLVRNLDTIMSAERYKLTVRAIGYIMNRISSHFDDKTALEGTIRSIAYDAQIDYEQLLRYSDPLVLARELLFAIQEVMRGKMFVKRNPACDLTLEIAFYQHPTDPSLKLARIFSEQKDYVTAWESIEGVSEYQYWNNSEEPEGITRKAWKKRAAVWDTVIGESGRSVSCLTWRLDIFPIATFVVDPVEVEEAIAEAALEEARAIAWYKRIIGSVDDDDKDSGGVPLKR